MAILPRFQVGDRVIARVSFRGIPQGAVGTITRLDSIPNVYDVQFDHYPPLMFVLGLMLISAPGAPRAAAPDSPSEDDATE